VPGNGVRLFAIVLFYESNMPKDRDRRGGLCGYGRGEPNQIKTVVWSYQFSLDRASILNM